MKTPNKEAPFFLVWTSKQKKKKRQFLRNASQLRESWEGQRARLGGKAVWATPKPRCEIVPVDMKARTPDFWLWKITFQLQSICNKQINTYIRTYIHKMDFLQLLPCHVAHFCFVSHAGTWLRNLGSMSTELAVSEHGRVFSGFCHGGMGQKTGSGLDRQGVPQQYDSLTSLLWWFISLNHFHNLSHSP